MRRIIWLALALMMVLQPMTVLAADVQKTTYALVPSTPTEENVAAISAQCLPDKPNEAPCSIMVMEPGELTVNTLQQIWDFVQVHHNPPARYFPQDVQEEIARLIAGDPAQLYMPEFMSLRVEQWRQDTDMQLDMKMRIDYSRSLPLVVVLGCKTDAGIVWKALPVRMIGPEGAGSVIRFTVPRETQSLFNGSEILFALLAAKPAQGDGEKDTAISEEEVFVPSKNASNIIYVEKESVCNTAGEVVDCQIFIVSGTKDTARELEKMTAYFIQPENTPIRYFDEETVRQTALMLDGVDTLLPYEVTQVMVKGYQESFGDVIAKFIFPTPFQEGKAIIAQIGVPDAQDPAVFHWLPLRTEKKGNQIEITFRSTVLPTMMEKAALLLVMSEPIEE